MNKFGEAIGASLMTALAITWSLAGPITFILAIVDTWHGHAAGWAKLLVSMTIDPFLAAFWPFTWLYWLVSSYNGNHTPMSLLF